MWKKEIEPIIVDNFEPQINKLKRNMSRNSLGLKKLTSIISPDYYPYEYPTFRPLVDALDETDHLFRT